jgi:surface carbohydrate biosynthesis protein
MPARPLLFLPIETKVREFHAKTYFASVAAREGFDVIMGHNQALWNQLDLMDRGIYVDKSVYLNRRDSFPRCRRLGNRVASWDEEGLVFSDPEIYRRLRIDPEALMLTERFFAWGQVQKEAICEAFPEAESRIVLCGNPRFDLLRPDLRSFYADAVGALKARYGRMLLVNTNFAFCNHFTSTDRVQATLKILPLEGLPGYVDGWIELQRKELEGFRQMLPALSERFPSHRNVIRPHPSENHQFWRDQVRGLRNVEVNADGNVHEWILASEAVVHFNCTTAIEAYLLGVPAIAFRPVSSGVYENPLPNLLSVEAFDTEHLLNRITLCVTEPRNPAVWLWTEDRERLVRRYISGLDGPTSAERMVQELRAVASGIERRRRTNQRMLALAKKTWRALRQTYLRWQGSSLVDRYVQHKLPSLSEEEIAHTLQRLATTAGHPMAYFVKEAAPGCFLITAAS